MECVGIIWSRLVAEPRAESGHVEAVEVTDVDADVGPGGVDVSSAPFGGQGDGPGMSDADNLAELAGGVGSWSICGHVETV